MVDDYSLWIDRFGPEECLLSGRAYEVAKRLLDILIMVLSLPLFILLVVIVYVIVKIDDPKSPAFYYQMRTGKGGVLFRMYKFRTMVPNAERLKESLRHMNQLQWPDFKISQDPRITRVGKFLRKTSLDELPQLINAFLGEMSLVGPRPTSFSADTYELWQTERLDVIPGITGLWQIYGRGTTEFRERLRMDISYMEHRCLLLDMFLLILTVYAVIYRRGT